MQFLDKILAGAAICLLLMGGAVEARVIAVPDRDHSEGRTLASYEAQPRSLEAEGWTRDTVTATTNTSEVTPEEPTETQRIRSVRLMWDLVPSAVRYQVVILRSEEDTADNIVATLNDVYTNGVTVNLRLYGSAAADFYYKVCPLNYDGRALRPFSKPAPITEGEANPTAPAPTTEFGAMDYMPVYPVYSWVPLAGAKQHEVQVYRHRAGGDTLLHTLRAGEYDIYEEGGFTYPGDYYWRVRGIDASGRATSDWSEKSYFTVGGQTPIAALGDSITHGGGAISVPPGQTLYNWETYCPVPVKNIGYSGNTTEAMLERFERDVLPFSPRVLVIMGGVNDYRGTTIGWQTVENLMALRDKCDAYGIIAVFATVTPINPPLMTSRAHIDAPPSDWQMHQQFINSWIMRQKYAVDVSGLLTDENGCLRSTYTTDGLHPDYFGKKYIGEQIGKYLQAHFSWITDKLQKK